MPKAVKQKEHYRPSTPYPSPHSSLERDDEPVPIHSRVEVTNVHKEKQEKKSQEKRRLVNSNFVFTINTNRRIGPYEEGLDEFCQQFQGCIDDIFQHVGNFLVILPEGHTFSRQYFKSVNPECYIERAESNDSIHGHLFIGIQHYSKIRLNRDKLRDKICHDLDLKGIYISKIGVLRNTFSTDLENWLDYCKKNMKKE